MKLYDFAFAPNPRRVRWLMAEKGVADIEIVPVDLMAGEHRTADYRAKVGAPHIPALEMDDGTVISESLAICRYLECLYPEPNLFGVGARDQAVIEMWTRRAEMYLATPMMLVVRHTHPAMAALEAPVPAVADYNRVTAERFMKLLDRHLAGRDFIALDRFTMADIVAFIGIDFARMIKYRADPALENLARWQAACRARPASAAA